MTFCAQMNYKISKVCNILDKMLTRCRGTIDEKLNNSFENVNYSIELLQKIGGQNKLVGILMCFKYFKSIINKYFKLSSKNKKLESLVDLNKLNEKLDSLSKKMEVLEKSIPNTFSSKNSTLTFKSGNSNNSLINSSNSCLSETNFAVHSQSSISFTNLDL
jgi:CHASE1-domain containing sensor protein